MILSIYALTFTGLNFRGFCGSAAILKIFIPQKFRPVWTIASQKCKNGSNSLGQLDMQLRTSTEAIDYVQVVPLLGMVALQYYLTHTFE